MLNLPSTPALGSMVLTREGVWRYTYHLPRGIQLPPDATAEIVITDLSTPHFLALTPQ